MKIHILLFIALAFSGIASAQDVYLCVGDAAGGVSFDGNSQKWKGAALRTSSKILVNKKNNKWTMKEFDSSLENECTQPNEYGVMSCNKIFGEFHFSTKTRRYISTYIAGYIDGRNNNDNTPYVEIGVCSKL